MEPVFNFVEMFERSIGLKDPWKVTQAEFDQRDRAVHVYVEARKTAKYACPVCGKYSKRYDDEDEERSWRHADVVSINWDQSRAYFEQGKAAMIIQGSWLPGSVEAEVPGFQTGFMPIPDEKGNVFMSYGLNVLISVNANSKMLDEAYRLMDVLIAKKSIEIRLKDSGFSGIKGTEVEYTLQAIKDYAAALQSKPSGLQPSTYFPPSVWPILNNIQSAIIAGQDFSATALDEAQAAYEKDKTLVDIPK